MLAELAGGFALALFAALPTPREEQEVQIPDTKVVVRVATVWPAQLHKGWIPCQVTVTNGEDRERTLEIRASAWAIQREVTARIDVPAESTSSIEMLLPAFNGVQNQFQIGAVLDGKRHLLPGNFGAPEVGQSGGHTVLHLSESEPDAGTTQRWTGEVSTAEIDESTSGFAAIRALGAIKALGYVGSASTPVPTPTGVTPNNIHVHHVSFDRLPQHAEAYSSIDMVVVDTSRGLPSDKVLAPLFAWMRLGGTVALFGPRAEMLARAQAELAPWMEPRFALGLASATSSWRAGLGLFLVDDEPAFSSDPQRRAIRESVLSGGGILDDAGGSRLQSAKPVLPDLFALPYKSFCLLLVLFAIVIGPVNFILVKRTKRPVLLLVTIPAIALSGAAALFVFGLLSQGLGVKVASYTYALLDQRSHRSMASEQRMIFAGLAPARGLEPGPGAWTQAIARYMSNRTWQPPSYGEHYVVDHDPGLVLSSDFLPARTAFLHQIVTDRAERARLEVVREGGALAVTNALGTTIESLLVRDAAGEYWTSEGAIGGSERRTLVKVGDPQEAANTATLLRLGLLEPDLPALPPACWLARLERGVFGDDCGVTGKEQVSYHHVLGVLDANGEEWR